MTDGEWGDPPPSNKGTWQRFVDELRERPGEWRCVFENRHVNNANSIVASLRRARAEVTTRQKSTPEGIFLSCWARWPE